MIRLQIDPKFWRGVEGLSKKPSGFRGYSSLSTNKLVDPLD